MVGNDGSSVNEQPDSSQQWPVKTRLDLAMLSPEVAQAPNAWIEGTTTLIWPFSASASTFSVILAEPDFRKRMNHGQLKVNFKGPSARAAGKRIKIGDTVSLSLEGVKFEELKDASQRDVPWTIEVEKKILMKIRGDDGEHMLDIDAPTIFRDEPDPPKLTQPTLPFTPRRSSGFSQSSATQWTTPGVFKRPVSSLSESPLFPPNFFNAGDDDDEEEEEFRPQKKKPRFSGSFRMVSRSPSPVPEATQSVPPSPVRESLPPSPRPKPELSPSPQPSRATSPVSRKSLIPASPALRVAQEVRASVITPTRPDSPRRLHSPLPASPLRNVSRPPSPSPASPFTSDPFVSRSKSPTSPPRSPNLRPVASPTLPKISPFLSKMAGIDTTKSSQISPIEAPSDSEKDSLFDETSAPPSRPRSPLPRSPLSNVFKPDYSFPPQKKPKLDLSIPRKPTSINTDHKTAQLYLPAATLSAASHPTISPSQIPFPPTEEPKSANSITTPTTSSLSFSPLHTPTFRSGLTTPLSDFPPLSFLSYNAIVDVFGIVSQVHPSPPPATPSSYPRATSGARDYFTAMRIVDSSYPSGVVVRVFRPYPDALPKVRVGDAILLRGFKVGSLKGRMCLGSTDNSAWAVWGCAEDGEEGKVGEPECRGPPVEFGDEEVGYVKGLSGWWKDVGEEERGKMKGSREGELGMGV